MIHSRMLHKRLGFNCFLALALVLNPLFICVTVAQTVQPSENLEPGKTVERSLKSGEKHTYPLALTDNNYLKLVLIQQGIDVVMRLLGPDGKAIREANNLYGRQGAETLTCVVEQAGNYSLEVESLEKTTPPGTYQLKLETTRTATERDQAEIEINTLNGKIVRLTLAGKYDEGLSLAQQTVEKSDQVFGPEHPLLASSLNNLALLYRNKGDFARAELLYQQALAIEEKALGPDHQDVALTLNNLALLYYSKGDLVMVEPLLQRALAINEKALGASHPDTANSYNSLAGYYWNKGDFVKVEPLLQQALEIWEQAFGADHPRVATALNNLASLYWNNGDYTRAEPLFLRTLAIREKVLGVDHPDVAQILNNLAEQYRTNGDYSRAEPLFQRALAIWEKTFGPDHPNVAMSLIGLAILYRDKGDEVRAESLHQRALAIREKALGADHPETANSLDNLAVLYYSKDDFARAEPLFQRALAIREKALGVDHLETARSLHNLALLYRDKGDDSRAEPLFQRALAIREKALGVDHPLVAYSLNHLAGLYRARNDYTRAEPLYQRALAILEKAFGTNHPDIATNLNSLGFLYQVKGDISQAIQVQIRSNNAIEHDLMRNLMAGSEYQKALYLKKTSDYTDRTISLHLQAAPQSSEAKEAALTVILRRKGRNLDAMTTAIETLRRQQTPETRKLLDKYASLAGQISVLTLRGPGKKKSAEHLAYLKELETQKDKLEAEISAKSWEFKAQITPITLESVQKLIPTDTALVEYAVYRPYDAKNQKFGNSRYAVYLLTHSGEVRFADLGEADLINQIIASLRSVLSRKSIMVTQNVKPVAQALDKLVMNPVRALVGNASHLLISPDGALNLIPFSALMDKQGKFLVENYTLTYLTSGRDLLRLAVKVESQQPPLVIADPNYLDGTGPQILGQPLGQLIRLAGTQAEGKQLKAIFSNAVLKTGSEATEQTFKQITRPALVHIATHGYFLEDTLPPTDLTPIDQARRNIELPPINLEQERQANPLLRSMLFFAGANQGGSDDNDGVMTALEAAQLNLLGTKLVTLSACDTGLGDVKNGDGVYGLRRALVLAGSESQMMSLWPVSDQATRELMVDYYQRLKAGEGRSQALRNVQLKMLKTPRRQHPFYWASFIQSGEWANLAGKR